jgi:transcription antitermination factor NusG
MDLSKLDQRWLALQVHTRAEASSAAFLTETGYEVLVPRKQSCHRCYLKCRGEPLLPGYILCRLDLKNNWQIVRTPGVLKIVSFGSAVVPVEDDEVQALRLADKTDRCRQAGPLITTGDRVAVTSGPLAGTVGRYLRNGSHGCIALSIELLRRSIIVQLQSDNVVIMDDRSFKCSLK